MLIHYKYLYLDFDIINPMRAFKSTFQYIRSSGLITTEMQGLVWRYTYLPLKYSYNENERDALFLKFI